MNDACASPARLPDARASVDRALAPLDRLAVRPCAWRIAAYQADSSARWRSASTPVDRLEHRETLAHRAHRLAVADRCARGSTLPSGSSLRFARRLVAEQAAGAAGTRAARGRTRPPRSCTSPSFSHTVATSTCVEIGQPARGRERALEERRRLGVRVHGAARVRRRFPRSATPPRAAAPGGSASTGARPPTRRRRRATRSSAVAARPCSSRRWRNGSSSYTVSRMIACRNRSRTGPSGTRNSPSSREHRVVGRGQVGREDLGELVRREAQPEHRGAAQDLAVAGREAVDLRGHRGVDRRGQRVDARRRRSSARSISSRNSGLPAARSASMRTSLREQRRVLGRARSPPRPLARS